MIHDNKCPIHHWYKAFYKANESETLATTYDSFALVQVQMGSTLPTVNCVSTWAAIDWSECFQKSVSLGQRSVSKMEEAL